MTIRRRLDRLERLAASVAAAIRQKPEAYSDEEFRAFLAVTEDTNRPLPDAPPPGVPECLWKDAAYWRQLAEGGVFDMLRQAYEDQEKECLARAAKKDAALDTVFKPEPSRVG